jgi:hypothetical protein
MALNFNTFSPNTGIDKIRSSISDTPEPIQLAKPDAVDVPVDSEVIKTAPVSVPTPIQDRGEVVSTRTKDPTTGEFGAEQQITPISPLSTIPKAEPVVPDFKPVLELEKEKAEQAKADAQARTDARIAEATAQSEKLKTTIAEGTASLTEKAEAQSAKELARKEQERSLLDTEYLKNRAIEQKNTANTFSHLLAQGKDNGFINAKNLVAVRDANRRYNDSKLSLDLQFIKDSGDIYKREYDNTFKLANDAYNKNISIDETLTSRLGSLGDSLMDLQNSIDEGASQSEIDSKREEITMQFNAQQLANDEWESNVKNLIDSYVELGDIETASEIAKQASELSDNSFYSIYSDPNILKELTVNDTLEKQETWARTSDQIKQLALTASGADAITLQQATERITALLATQPVKGEVMMKTHFGSIDESEFDELGIDETDKAIIEQFKNGKRNFDDPALQEIFANSYIADTTNDMKRQEVADMLDQANISQRVKDSLWGNEAVTEWLSEGQTSDWIDVDIEGDDIFGEGATRLYFYNREINPNDADSLSTLPGFDITLEGFKGDNNDPDIFIGDHTPQVARSKDITVGGETYKQGDLMDSYLDYVNRFGKKYSGMSNEEKLNAGEPLNRDQYEAELRNATIKDGRTDLNDLNNTLFGQRTIDDVGIEQNQYVGADGTIKTINEEVSALDKEDISTVISILEGETNPNNLSFNDFHKLLTNTDGTLKGGVVEQLEDSNIIQADAIDNAKLERGQKITQTDSPFSMNNIDATLDTLNYEDGVFTGNILYGVPRVPYKITVGPGRYHPSKGHKIWQSTADITLTPASGQGEPITFKSELPGIGNTGWSGSTRTPADTGALNKANEWFKTKGGE